MRKLILGLLACSVLGCGDRKIKPYPVHGTSSSNTSTVGVSAASSSASGADYSWPDGPGGVKIDQIVPASFEWDGVKTGESSPTKLYVVDWYDPDGIKNIDAVLVITSKYDCQACVKEAKELESRASFWRDSGLNIKIVALVFNSPTNSPADISSAIQWKSMYSLNSVDVGADPSALFAHKSLFSTPLNTVVDPRTMKVIEVREGYVDSYENLETLAYINGT